LTLAWSKATTLLSDRTYVVTNNRVSLGTWFWWDSIDVMWGGQNIPTKKNDEKGSAVGVGKKSQEPYSMYVQYVCRVKDSNIK
jgi:hypothetical protein